MKDNINIKISYFRSAIFLLLGLAWFSSCTKQDTNPQLEIKVVNLYGEPVPDVSVGLFDELDEWSMMENPVQVWRETDQNGEVMFVDLFEQVYYIYADGDSLSNIGHKIMLDKELRINEIKQLTVTIE